MRAWAAGCVLCLACAAQTKPNAAGAFENHGDVGTVLHEGSVEYDAGKQSYRVRGSGENMWAASDAFHFAWKKVSGDVALTADISFAGAGGDAHKKAVLMIRQSLDADSAYAGAALHGNGLASLQARDERGAATHEIQSNLSAPKRLRITKLGKYFYMSVAGEGEDLRLAGGSMRVTMEEPFYVGIGVCAHNKDATESAAFTNVEIAPPAASSALAKLFGGQGTINVPSWSPDSRRLAFVSYQLLP